MSDEVRFTKGASGEILMNIAESRVLVVKDPADKIKKLQSIKDDYLSRIAEIDAQIEQIRLISG